MNIEQIYEFNSKLLAELQNRIQSNTGTILVGDVSLVTKYRATDRDSIGDSITDTKVKLARPRVTRVPL